MDEGLFELIILSSGGLLVGVSPWLGGGWGRHHTSSQAPPAGGGVNCGVSSLFLCFLQWLMPGRSLESPSVQGGFSELGTVVPVACKTPS